MILSPVVPSLVSQTSFGDPSMLARPGLAQRVATWLGVAEPQPVLQTVPAVSGVWRSVPRALSALAAPAAGSAALLGAGLYSAAAQAADGASQGSSDFLAAGGLIVGGLALITALTQLPAIITAFQLPKSAEALRQTVEARGELTVPALAKLMAKGEKDFNGISLAGLKHEDYISFKGASLRGASLVSASLGRWGGKNPPPRGTRAHFEGADLTEANLAGSKIPGGRFENAVLERVNARGADLSGSKFLNAKLDGADLRGADLSSTDFGGASLKGADLRNANLGKWDGSRSSSPEWYAAQLAGADLTDADLRGAILPVSCAGITFIGTKITAQQRNLIESRGGSAEGAVIC